ncbi:ribulose-phosphate 3-epimerase [Halobacteriovorax vibrionivorans]|uniref:Ribulose-phosphate 3-epimerase n=1 Tax=Halobacteriovorax vibrionivorans TaxID=2152716 RepID=A0ABY0IJA2_9BACT|nr:MULTISPECIES: ribulose-phosphate 3-epimerase [Halobacteriovorax]RZF23027.1 ribulose-phosphate 3-epimerase [Halobacteriovorax vibrionivorans]TGD48801.1 ribulose-phosphate 3-epimerase [Halobacteriovorax sp. Y22]
MKTIISPSILAADFTNLISDISVIEDVNDLWLHLDVMDGHFVPNLTFGIPIIKQLKKKTKLPLDVHLMVTNPEFHMEELKDVGIENITYHFEIETDHMELISKYRSHYNSIGLSIKPKTKAQDLDLELLKKLDLVLVMSVEPGFGGQSFMPNALDKIEYLNKVRKENNLSFKIQVDGGINKETGTKCRNKGADNMVAGSYIFGKEKDQYKTQIETLR